MSLTHQDIEIGRYAICYRGTKTVHLTNLYNLVGNTN